MIEPFHERTTAHGLTFGLGPAGYDLRIKDRLSLLPSAHSLAITVERLHMPNDVQAKVADKSTWARRFLSVANTVIDPGFDGYLTLEITNHSYRIVNIEAGSPICQLIFFKLDEPTELPYGGKYQGAGPEPQEAILEG